MVNRGTVGVNSLPKTVTRQRRECDLNPGPSAPESSTELKRCSYHSENNFISFTHHKMAAKASLHRNYVIVTLCIENPADFRYRRRFDGDLDMALSGVGQ